MERFAFVAIVAIGLVGALPVAARAEGCLKGGAVGGVVGHELGSGHGAAGAATGCAVGHHEAKKQDKKAARSNANAKHQENGSGSSEKPADDNKQQQK
jgi:hypothetical protein